MLPSPPGCGLGSRIQQFSRSLRVHFCYSLTTRDHPLRWYVDRLQSLGLPPLRYPSYGALTTPPAGLPPAECLCLLWTHNQAAAFARISRSICSRLFSRRRCASSSRSVVVNPPSPRPSSRSACLTQRLIAHGVGPNCRARSLSVRPARCSSTIWCRNSFGYRLAYFDLTMADDVVPEMLGSLELD